MILRTVVRGIANIPAARALAVSGLLWLLVFAYCDQALWRDPHGAYFHSEHIYDLDYSRVRQQEARDFVALHANATAAAHATDPDPDPDPNPDLKLAAAVQPSALHAGNDPALCAAFVSVHREHPDAARYFSDAIGSMLQGLTPTERVALNVSVLFADAADPARHPDFGASWLSTLVDHASGYEGLSEAELADRRRLEETEDFQRKGVLDYIYVLDKCYRTTNAPFIAVFEDDIVFAADWLARTLFALQHLAVTPSTTEKQKESPWLYLRLFYTETFLAWDAAVDWWYGHMELTFALACFTSLTSLLFLRQCLLWWGRRRSGNNGNGHAPTRKNWNGRSLGLGLRLDIPTIVVLSAFVAPAFTALVFMAGKYNLPTYALRGHSRTLGNMVPGVPAWQKHAGVLPMDTQGCCTQAMVFDRARVPDLIAYLRKRGRGQTDLMIEEYCQEKSLRRFALGEQAVQHVGVVSSRGPNTVNGQSVWAFYFEESRAEAIRARHQTLVKDINWDAF